MLEVMPVDPVLTRCLDSQDKNVGINHHERLCVAGRIRPRVQEQGITPGNSSERHGVALQTASCDEWEISNKI